METLAQQYAPSPVAPRRARTAVQIAYASVYDAGDVTSWSGIPYHMIEALRRAEHAVHPLGPLGQTIYRLCRARQAWVRLRRGQRYLRDRDPQVLQNFAWQLAEKLRAYPGSDLILSSSAIPLAYLEGRTPAALWTDCTFAGMLDFYGGFTNVCDESIRQGHAAEQQAFDRCDHLIFCSDWAAETALRHYRVDRRKVHVIPFGANISWSVPEGEVMAGIARRSPDCCRLLQLGVEWERKGAPLAVQVARELRRRGIPVELRIVGCQAPAGTELPEYVHVTPFLNKSTEAGSEQLRNLLSESHFLLLPSQAECYGMVFTEANSLGVPCLATNVGGIGTIIRNGVNGRMFAPEAGPDAYADTIEHLFGDRHAYRQLADSSYREYAIRLNWKTAIRSFEAVVTGPRS